MLKLNQINLIAEESKFIYNYSYDSAISKYFKPERFFSQYDLDVSAVPQSISVIPFLANFAPIAWFAGFDITVDEIDEDFYNALLAIKQELIKHHPVMEGKVSNINGKLVKNKINGGKSAMLFSGGVDAFATYFRHFDESPDLVTIKGADIELDDEKQWQEVLEFNENEPILKNNDRHYVITNLKDFYSYEVDMLLPNRGWWGNIQHGLALIGSLAPLSFLKGHSRIYIASTRSIHMTFNAWGSMPETDEKISWGGLQVHHDGFELKRQDKVDLIVKSLEQLGKKTTIRVCYSDIKKDLNCSHCEKCVRTIYGIILAGGNPNEFGFRVDSNIYNRIESTLKRGFRTKGSQFFWRELADKSKSVSTTFYFDDPQVERQKQAELLQLIDQQTSAEIAPLSGFAKFKYKVINSYPKLFEAYLKIRRSL
ncbi:MAG: hypothetical protein IR153_08290 [Flavobacterium sp.]|nr:hypothetical protein [Flavobacterium sp.]